MALTLAVFPLFAAGAPSLGCTTTLDPTSLEPSSDVGQGGASDQPSSAVGSPSNGCLAETEEGSSGFNNCVELLPCTPADEENTVVLCSHALSYDAAAHECRLRGGYLAEVESEEENLLIAETAGPTVGTNVWLGGRRSEAFVWAWQSSQTVFWRGEREGTPEEGVFVMWQPGEPNNSSTVSDEPEKCLALTLGDVDWNDRACSLELPFACEFD